MPVPATTGSLKTSIHDMEIGDYIVASSHRASSSSVPRLNTNMGNEHVLNSGSYEDVYSGTTTGSILFYYVKVAKGLLISDRVIYHTISWDLLNTNKLIQELPWDNGNIIPIMTSNNSPSGVASASGEYVEPLNNSKVYRAWEAFHDNYTGWLSDTPGRGWLSYQFAKAEIVNGYKFKSSGSMYNLEQAPKSWTFEGFDGENWVILDEQKDVTNWIEGEYKSFSFSNSTPYLTYRILVTENQNTSRVVNIGHLEMYDTAGTIRSLTGGVAYADENGNKSTMDQSFGAWPTNNEWDRYIVNFPEEKIQVGKTLDDVFHSSNIRAWTQDTPDVNLSSGSPSSRVTRGGGSGVENVVFYTSSGATTTNGFRPCFEYKE
ncbi:hypothetical protein [Oceanobacillus profundus]|uniref:F5/8 type C domain-containing protein n=1 Tax=Oceanobacillus profundus TaxID=372463 RepID=A0A417YGR8_9BACI|nr:hypothetical protein [Oceanobacillus profundus]RHW32007.1 hypothetical protein D1B32_12285 [Oceanobacillus profundus]